MMEGMKEDGLTTTNGETLISESEEEQRIYALRSRPYARMAPASVFGTTLINRSKSLGGVDN